MLINGSYLETQTSFSKALCKLSGWWKRGRCKPWNSNHLRVHPCTSKHSSSHVITASGRESREDSSLQPLIHAASHITVWLVCLCVWQRFTSASQAIQGVWREHTSVCMFCEFWQIDDQCPWWLRRWEQLMHGDLVPIWGAKNFVPSMSPICCLAKLFCVVFSRR